VQRVDHRHDQQRRSEHGGGHEPGSDGTRRVGVGVGRGFVGHAIAEVDDAPGEIGARDALGIERDRGPARRVVDRCPGHPRQIGQPALDPGRARGAGHPLDGQVQLGHVG
jgi:hypothetical protein